MFGNAYFPNSYWGDAYWGEGETVVTAGGARKTAVKGKKKKKKWDDLTEAEIQGMKAVYGQGFENAPEPEILTETLVLPEKQGIELQSSEFLSSLDALSSQVQMSDDIRMELQKTQDIGLILAIIEALD